MSDDERQQWTEAGRWFVKANQDLATAAVLLDASPPLVESAAFHCQQAAEKILKGLLITLGRRPPRIHDIEALLKQVEPDFPWIVKHADVLAGLTPWYVGPRYPDFGVDIGPSFDDVRESLITLQHIRKTVGNLDPSKD